MHYVFQFEFQCNNVILHKSIANERKHNLKNWALSSKQTRHKFSFSLSASQGIRAENVIITMINIQYHEKVSFSMYNVCTVLCERVLLTKSCTHKIQHNRIICMYIYPKESQKSSWNFNFIFRYARCNTSLLILLNPSRAEESKKNSTKLHQWATQRLLAGEWSL